MAKVIVLYSAKYPPPCPNYPPQRQHNTFPPARALPSCDVLPARGQNAPEKPYALLARCTVEVFAGRDGQIEDSRVVCCPRSTRQGLCLLHCLVLRRFAGSTDIAAPPTATRRVNAARFGS